MLFVVVVVAAATAVTSFEHVQFCLELISHYMEMIVDYLIPEIFSFYRRIGRGGMAHGCVHVMQHQHSILISRYNVNESVALNCAKLAHAHRYRNYCMRASNKNWQ